MTEIDRLAAFILRYYPHEIGVGNFQHGESAVDVAIRLLSKEEEKEDDDKTKE